MESSASIRRKITLNDIAAGCGVSRATVSLVLRGSPLVNKNTRARVEDELRRQGYVYNRAAANLRRRTSSSVALVLNDLANPFFAEFAAGVDEVLAEGEFVTLLGNTGESAEREQAVLGSLIEHGPGGIILSPAEGSDARHVLAAVGTQTPVLLFNRELGGSLPEYAHWDRLMLDNQRGAKLATQHLLEQGHRRIAFFGGHDDSSSVHQRLDGYREAMHEAGVDVLPHWRVETAPTRMDAARATEQLFAHDAAPTAAVCYNDAVALGLMLGLNQRGIKPGEDFAITGFDDVAEAAFSTPPLTTLATDPRARGRQAAQILLARLRNPQADATTTVAPVTLVIRESSAHPPRS
ncbi:MULTISPECIES: LacI family DNA-binding transcriptional regulator [Dyella]|uniref:LacI family DNA-binding transcriptional regulator n=2 Tax=Dyella TaxID=231454 RepID=A0A4R0YHK2_9GAMM|nr:MULTISPECIES: LacI family DNA-binding transcriptional regulator [Dyella]TBR37019.1 LacI family DNA-binding transcriptional regulator [Dyella terrae]TCI07892.1 LacI family DNA-binding transcriptional regulator [Dyella soli]